MKQKRGNGAVLYVRVSTDEQASGSLSLIHQEQRRGMVGPGELSCFSNGTSTTTPIESGSGR
jgi:hypothetical protein